MSHLYFLALGFGLLLLAFLPALFERQTMTRSTLPEAIRYIGLHSRYAATNPSAVDLEGDVLRYLRLGTLKATGRYAKGFVTIPSHEPITLVPRGFWSIARLNISASLEGFDNDSSVFATNGEAFSDITLDNTDLYRLWKRPLTWALIVERVEAALPD